MPHRSRILRHSRPRMNHRAERPTAAWETDAEAPSPHRLSPPQDAISPRRQRAPLTQPVEVIFSKFLHSFLSPNRSVGPLWRFRHIQRNDQFIGFSFGNMHIAVTIRLNLLSMPRTNTRTTAFKRANPARFLGESDRPVKDLLPISITQREHLPHLSEPGLTQGTPVPLLGALLQGQTQQILRRQGILQKHRQLRPILPHITHNTTPNQQPHTHQRHTPTQPRNKTATSPTVRHAPIQPHHTATQKQSVWMTGSGTFYTRAEHTDIEISPPATPQPAKPLVRSHLTTTASKPHGLNSFKFPPPSLTAPQEP